MQVENTGICLGYGKDYGDSKMYIYFSHYFYNIIMVSTKQNFIRKREKKTWNGEKVVVLSLFK